MKLQFLKSSGLIGDFERVDTPSRVRWRIEVRPTRLQAFRNEGSFGVIVLSTREVAAFVEGVWVGQGVYPVHRAGTFG